MIQLDTVVYRFFYKRICIITGGQKGHPFFAFIRDMLWEYWKRNIELIDYLLSDCYITIAYDRIVVIRDALNRVPYSNNRVCVLVLYLLSEDSIPAYMNGFVPTLTFIN